MFAFDIAAFLTGAGFGAALALGVKYLRDRQASK